MMILTFFVLTMVPIMKTVPGLNQENPLILLIKVHFGTSVALIQLMLPP